MYPAKQRPHQFALTILTPVYNNATYIHRLITSIHQQDISVDDYEIIFIDDGCTDNTFDVIKQAGFTHYRILRNYVNYGVNTGLFRGYYEAKSKYILGIASDDSLTPYSLKRRLEYLENNRNVTMSGGYLTIEKMDNNGNITDTYMSKGSGIHLDIVLEMPISFSGAIIRAEFLDYVKIYDNLHARNPADYATLAYFLCEPHGYPFAIHIDDAPVANFLARSNTVGNNERTAKSHLPDDLPLYYYFMQRLHIPNITMYELRLHQALRANIILELYCDKNLEHANQWVEKFLTYHAQYPLFNHQDMYHFMIQRLAHLHATYGNTKFIIFDQHITINLHNAPSQ